MRNTDACWKIGAILDSCKTDFTDECQCCLRPTACCCVSLLKTTGARCSHTTMIPATCVFTRMKMRAKRRRAASYWGLGYASEAARAMLAFGFNEIELHRIWAQCNAENQASWRVLEKLGMRLEGRLRQDDFFKGRWWDDLIYAILENEWNPL